MSKTVACFFILAGLAVAGCLTTVTKTSENPLVSLRPIPQAEILLENVSIPLYEGSLKETENCREGAYHVEGGRLEELSAGYCSILAGDGWEILDDEKCRPMADGGFYFEKDGRTLLVTFEKSNGSGACYYPRLTLERR